jgi:hypothetical protein
MSESVILTRRQLYDLIWSKPLRDVAGDLGLSDVGLAKVCDRHRVPRPPQGYWNKLHAGKKVKQTIFVEATDPDLDRVEINGGAHQLPEPARAILARAKAERSPKRINRPDEISPDANHLPMDDIHPAIKPTARALRKGHADTDDAVHAVGEGLCGVSVGVGCIERAITLLNALARSADAQELPIVPMGNAMKVALGPDSATFTLSERTRREKHIPTDQERAAEERRLHRQRKNQTWNSFSDLRRAYPEFDTVRSGELIVKIEGYGSGARRTWSDGKQQRLENLVPDIVIGLSVSLSVEKSRREEREESNRRWRELERRRELAAKRRDREKKRHTFLAKTIARNNTIGRLREWLALNASAAEAMPNSNFARMIVWVRDRLIALQTAADPRQIDDALKTWELFPEVDGLHDPEGDPPRDRWW